MTALYYEIDKHAAAWLRELIDQGLIAPGEVYEGDMWDAVPNDIGRFTQAHFCAGIGVWSHALRCAEWPDDRPVWTISLPCQPFSAAGKGGGFDDHRGQLADAFFWLAGVCRPDIILGEQVEAALRHDWWDVMASQMERIGYTVGAVAFPSGLPFHIRQRVYWLAHNHGARLEEHQLLHTDLPGGRSPTRGVADADGIRPLDDQQSENGREAGTASKCSHAGLLADAVQPGSEDRQRPAQPVPVEGGHAGILADTGNVGLSGDDGREPGPQPENRRKPHFWSNAVWIPCRDGKWRPTGPGIHPLVVANANRRTGQRSESQPIQWSVSEADSEYSRTGPVEPSPLTLADGPPVAMVPSGDHGPSEAEANETAEGRVMRLRGYGNAIVAPAATEFIRAVMDSLGAA